MDPGLQNPSPPAGASLTISTADINRDTARISAEIANAAHGTDPFAEAVRATRMPMVISDPRLPDNPIVFTNDAFCRLTGYERDEIVGRNCRFLQGPETDPAVTARIREAVRSAQPIQIDIRNHRKSGEAFWNRLLMAPVFGADAKLAYFFASQVDVTIERERLAGLENHNAALMAEVAGRLRAQEESEARLRFATQAGRLGIWELDLRNWTLNASGVFKEIFGRDPAAAFTHEDLEAAIHPDDRERVMSAKRRAAQNGTEYYAEYRIIRPDGTMGWVQVRAQVVNGVDGAALRMAGICLDTTDRRNAEIRLQISEESLRAANEGLEQQIAERTAALRTSEARLRTIFETSYQFQGLIGLDGTLLDANATSLAAIDSELADVVGQDFAETPWFRTTKGMPDTVRKALDVVREGGSFRQELLVDLPSGTRSFDFSLRPIHDDDHAPIAIVPEAVETTERRRTEEALRQAQKMEAVGQLTGGIAHDFNNLLAGIMGSLELLQRRVALGRTDGVDRYTAAAMTSAQRASALTQRLLAFARRQPLDPKMVDANRLVADMEDLLRRTLGPGIALEMVLAGGLWTTMSDPNQLESAILNLAINARDAMQEGSAAGHERNPSGGRLTIETGNAYLDEAYARAQGDEVRPGQYVQISVTDTGTGMPQDIIEKAFDPFFTTKPTGQGTGLGLSMVYGFVKQSEGHVRIYSEIGQGTTFKIYLPRHRGRADASDSITPDNPTAELRAEIGETVLVVDDEATVRMLVTETLEDLGYAAIEAADGPAGLAILQSDARIDLLVTDVGLPGLNGRQLADAARIKRPHLKILFMTGYAHNAAIGNGTALDNGMEIMTKPFTLDDLAKKIRDMIEAG
jgi:PAS domain S-box-containing protein